MIDLHTHSTASDGALSPHQLMTKAHNEGLSAIALSDHDTLAGLAEAEVAAKAFGIKFIPAIELDIAFQPGEFHLLGFNVPQNSTHLNNLIEKITDFRILRNKAIINKLQADGLDVCYEELTEFLGHTNIGRPHIAAYMVHKKIVKTVQAAFDKYIAKGRPHYVNKECVDISEAVFCLKEAGALAFVAHPMSLFVSWTRLRTFFAEWKELGIDGIEAWHPGARLVECQRLSNMALEFGFRISAGSDFHGPVRPERRLGHTVGGRPIDNSFLDAVLPANN